MKRIRNRQWKESVYTLEARDGERYLVTNTKNGHTWTIRGWNGEVEDGDPFPIPQYVIETVEREWARNQLREVLPPGSTVYTTLHHVSSTGMSRRIGVRAIVNGEPRYLDGLVAKACGLRISENHEGIIMGGCGMDMGFALAYELAGALYPDGFRCLGKKRRCPANDHSNDYSVFSHKYDEEHAQGAPWWLTDDRMIGSEEYELSDEDRERRQAYRAAKRAAWEAGEKARYSRRRLHKSGAYALNHRWL